MSHIVESCPLTKLNGALSRLHSADEDAVSWLTGYGSRNAYEKKTRMCSTDTCQQPPEWAVLSHINCLIQCDCEAVGLQS